MTTASSTRVRSNVGIKVGDIFRATCGYSMVYYHYYEVVRLVGKASVEVRELAKIEPGFQGYAFPVPGKYVGNATRRGFVHQSPDSTPYFSPARSSEYARLLTAEAFAKDVAEGVWEDYMD